MEKLALNFIQGLAKLTLLLCFQHSALFSFLVLLFGQSFLFLRCRCYCKVSDCFVFCSALSFMNTNTSLCVCVLCAGSRDRRNLEWPQWPTADTNDWSWCWEKCLHTIERTGSTEMQPGIKLEISSFLVHLKSDISHLSIAQAPFLSQ